MIEAEIEAINKVLMEGFKEAPDECLGEFLKSVQAIIGFIATYPDAPIPLRLGNHLIKMGVGYEAITATFSEQHKKKIGALFEMSRERAMKDDPLAQLIGALNGKEKDKSAKTFN